MLGAAPPLVTCVNARGAGTCSRRNSTVGHQHQAIERRASFSGAARVRCQAMEFELRRDTASIRASSPRSNRPDASADASTSLNNRTDHVTCRTPPRVRIAHVPGRRCAARYSLMATAATRTCAGRSLWWRAVGRPLRREWVVTRYCRTIRCRRQIVPQPVMGSRASACGCSRNRTYVCRARHPAREGVPIQVEAADSSIDAPRTAGLRRIADASAPIA